MRWFLRNATSNLVDRALRLDRQDFSYIMFKSTVCLTPLAFDSLNDDLFYNNNNNNKQQQFISNSFFWQIHDKDLGPRAESLLFPWSSWS